MENLFIFLLVITSIVGLTFIVERGWALRWKKVMPTVVESAVSACRTPADVPTLRRICEQQPSPLARLLLLAAEHLDCPKEENVDALQTRARHEITQLE